MAAPGSTWSPGAAPRQFRARAQVAQVAEHSAAGGGVADGETDETEGRVGFASGVNVGLNERGDADGAGAYVTASCGRNGDEESMVKVVPSERETC
jgi:hypothetical protein